MNFINHQLSISPLRLTAAVIGVAAVWLLMPEIVQAAVTFGEIGENVAENAKGVAKGVTLAGYASGAGMGVWGCVDMYKATKTPGRIDLSRRPYQDSGRSRAARSGRNPRFRLGHAFRSRSDLRHE